jgi:hypothetical protein
MCPGDRLEQIPNEVEAEVPEANAPRSHPPGARRHKKKDREGIERCSVKCHPAIAPKDGDPATLRKMCPGDRLEQK